MEKRLSNDLSFLTAFTYGKSIDEVSTASLGFHGGGYARDWNHPEWEKGPSDFDQKFRFVNSFSYTLPIGKGKKFLGRLNGVGNAILGGWELQGIQSYTSGVPLTIQASNGESNTDGDAEERPNRRGGRSALSVAIRTRASGLIRRHLWRRLSALYGNSGP